MFSFVFAVQTIENTTCKYSLDEYEYNVGKNTLSVCFKKNRYYSKNILEGLKCDYSEKVAFVI